MKRRRLLVILIVLFAGAVATVVVSPGEKEPQYQGRTLTRWLQQMQVCNSNWNAAWGWYASYPDGRQRMGKFCKDRDDAMLVVKHMGTNALPWLVKWSSYKRPAWRSWMMTRAGSARWPWEKDACQWLISAGGDERHFELAPFGFWAFGQDAEPVVADMVRLVGNGDSRLAESAAWNLKLTRAPGCCALAMIMTNQSLPKSSRISAAQVLWARDVYPIGSGITNCVPALLVASKDEDTKIRTAAEDCLRWLPYDWTMRP